MEFLKSRKGTSPEMPKVQPEAVGTGPRPRAGASPARLAEINVVRWFDVMLFLLILYQ